MISGLAPGTILQYMFIRNRLKRKLSKNNTFIEVGSGNGNLSNLLLENGYNGIGVDLNQSACNNNRALNEHFINRGLYNVINDDFKTISPNKYDFLISCMVIEHIDDNGLKSFLEHAKLFIKPNGRMIFLVPSNKDAWGIEDEIAGHIKRYNFKEIKDLASNNGMRVDYVCGLNYPISNWLLKLSNRIVERNENHLKDKSDLEKTIYTGNRNVKFKTVFPTYSGILLNELVLLPFHWFQRLNSKNEKSLVMYFELTN